MCLDLVNELMQENIINPEFILSEVQYWARTGYSARLLEKQRDAFVLRIYQGFDNRVVSAAISELDNEQFFLGLGGLWQYCTRVQVQRVFNRDLRVVESELESVLLVGKAAVIFE